MNMQRVKASCDIQSLCVPFPAGQWGSHNKQQPKKIMCYHGNFSQNQKRMKRKREAPQKQTDRIKGSLWPFCLPALKWGARGEVEFWKTRDQSRKKKRKKECMEPKWAREEGTYRGWERAKCAVWFLHLARVQKLFWLEKKRDIRGMKECHSWSSAAEREKHRAL